MIINTFKNLVFIVFTALLLLFQTYLERGYRRDRFSAVLDNVYSLTHNYINKEQLNDSVRFDRLSELISIIPVPNERITKMTEKVMSCMTAM